MLQRNTGSITNSPVLVAHGFPDQLKIFWFAGDMHGFELTAQLDEISNLWRIHGLTGFITHITDTI